MRMQDGMRQMGAERVHALAEGLEALVRGSGFASEPVSMFFEDESASES
jgi:hypothetical protein